jgi:flagellar motor protein MotB
VFDAKTLKKLVAKIELIDLTTGKQVVEAYSNKLTGGFLVCLQGNKDYAMNVSSNGYLFHSENFSLKNQDASDPLTLNIGLRQIATGEKVVLKNIFFDTDKFVLKDESKIEIEKLIEFMNANPRIKIEVGGHTDNVGDKKKMRYCPTTALRQYMIIWFRKVLYRQGFLLRDMQIRNP